MKIKVSLAVFLTGLNVVVAALNTAQEGLIRGCHNRNKDRLF